MNIEIDDRGSRGSGHMPGVGDRGLASAPVNPDARGDAGQPFDLPVRVPTISCDRSGSWPVLMARGADDTCVALNSRRDPVGEARWQIDLCLRGQRPAHLVIIGLGLGYVLDAIEQMYEELPAVMAFEPLAAGLQALQARRDWSPWSGGNRLRIAKGPAYSEAGIAWRVLAAPTLPPAVVHPVLARRWPDLVAGARSAFMRARFRTALDPRNTVVRQSMLHHTILTIMEHLASMTQGAVVEIGAYKGGGTLAMSRGIRDSGRDTPMFTIEPGGTYPGHPDLPSDDIFADLQANLATHDLAGYVRLLQGCSSDPEVLAAVREGLLAAGVQIGMLCIDADGQVQRDFDLYLPLCAPGAILMVDDYSGPPENIKTDSSKMAVDALVSAGLARELGVYGWGTWFGVYRA